MTSGHILDFTWMPSLVGHPVQIGICRIYLDPIERMAVGILVIVVVC